MSPESIRRYQRQLLAHKTGERTLAVSTAKEAMVRLRDMLKYAMDGGQSRQYWGISFDPWPQRGLKWPDNRERPAPRTYVPYSVDEAHQYLSGPPLSTCDHSSCLSFS